MKNKIIIIFFLNFGIVIVNLEFYNEDILRNVYLLKVWYIWVFVFYFQLNCKNMIIYVYINVVFLNYILIGMNLYILNIKY